MCFALLFLGDAVHGIREPLLHGPGERAARRRGLGGWNEATRFCWRSLCQRGRRLIASWRTAAMLSARARTRWLRSALVRLLAICLVVYGQAARLTRVGVSRAGMSGAQMGRGWGEGSASVACKARVRAPNISNAP